MILRKDLPVCLPDPAAFPSGKLPGMQVFELSDFPNFLKKQMNPARPQLVITFKLLKHLLFGILDLGFWDLGFLILGFWDFMIFGFWILGF